MLPVVTYFRRAPKVPRKRDRKLGYNSMTRIIQSRNKNDQSNSLKLIR